MLFRSRFEYCGQNGNTQGEKKLNSPCIKTVKAEIPVSIENPICFSPFFLLFGLYQLGVFGSSKVLGSEHRFPIRLEKMTMSPITAFIMGFAFSFAWTPCVGPALTSVLLMAGSAESGAKGFLLIGVYTIGFILPFL